MRRLLLITLLAGCDTGEVVSMELPPSQPPPVAIAPGTRVQQIWQFANPCRTTVTARILRATDVIGGAAVLAGETVYVPVRCSTGEPLTLEVAGAVTEEQECTTGTLPVRRFARCE